MKKMAPGIYDDGEGGMRVDVPEVLAHFGLPDTEENREAAMRTLAEVSAQVMPGTQRIEARIVTCHACFGRGRIASFMCGNCDGRGKIEVRRHLADGESAA